MKNFKMPSLEEIESEREEYYQEMKSFSDKLKSVAEKCRDKECWGFSINCPDCEFGKFLGFNR